jgi:serine/threonine protein kinase
MNRFWESGSMPPTTTCPEPGFLKKLLDERLPEKNHSELSAHLETCARCQRTLEELVAGRDSWNGMAARLRLFAPARDPTLGEAIGKLKDLADQATTWPEPVDAGELVLASLAPSDTPGHLGRLGHYEVSEIIGQGGMGVVLKAFDQVLRRVVAIKVLSPPLASSASARLRFLREGRAAAAVSHDHLITIHAVDEHNGLPYLVMPFVSGCSLQERIDRGGQLELREILRIGHQTARGLMAAHAQGLVHRDIKPANILLENGVERVKITDFGLARTADDVSVTQTGVLAGTPLYMSPEQARGETVDFRSDLFSLGSVLFAMCTRETPFRASTTLGVLHRVVEEAPPSIAACNPEIPSWLNAVIERLLAKNPADRFASAAEVADLLEQHLAHLQAPSLARRPRLPASPRRNGRRARLVMLSAILGVGLLVLAESTGHTSFVKNLMASLTSDNTDRADVAVVRKPNADGPPPKGPVEIRRFLGHHGPAKAVFLGDGRRLVSVGCWPEGDRTLRLWNVETGEEIRRFEAPQEFCCVAASPDGRHVLAGAVGGLLLLWDVETGAIVRRLEGHPQAVLAVAFSADGSHALSGGRDGSVRLWETARGTEVRRFDGHDDWVRGVAFSPDGRRALSGGRDKTIRMWDLAAGKEVRRFEPNAETVEFVVFSPDGTHALSGGGAILRMWDVETGNETRRFVGHKLEVNCAAFSPDGCRILSGGYDTVVHLWDVASGRAIDRLHGHKNWVWSIAFSPDGRTALSAGGGTRHEGRAVRGSDFAIRLWSLPPAQ